MSKAIECWHGVNSSPSYYPFEICSRILVPFNLVYEGKIKIEWVKEMQDKDIKIMIDSGAARYYLNTNQGYPKDYLAEYLDFLEELKPDWAFALDFCFENLGFRTNKKLQLNIISQINSMGQARERGLVLLPVVQGWDKKSYQYSASITNNFLRMYNKKEFGVGSICRAEKKRVGQVLSWICKIIDLNNGHCFGQTQRTIPILRKFGLARVDTSNASGNAGHRCYCDPFGNWFYGQKSPHNPKHYFEKLELPTQEFYHLLFQLNYESLEHSCDKVPKNWVHRVHQNRIDNYCEVKSHA